MKNSLKTVEKLLEEAIPLITWYYKIFHLSNYNAEQDIMADAVSYIIKRAQNFEHRDTCTFKSFMRLPLQNFMLNLKPKYDAIVGCKTWQGYDANKLKPQVLKFRNPHYRLFQQVSLDQVNENGQNLYNLVGVTQPSQLDITFFPNHLKDALTKEELKLVKLLFVDGKKYRGYRRKAETLRTDKWKKQVLKLVQTSDLRPKNLTSLFRNNNQNIDRLRYKLQFKVYEYYKQHGYNVQPPISYLYRGDYYQSKERKHPLAVRRYKDGEGKQTKTSK